MIKKPFNTRRKRGQAPKMWPGVEPDWYKRFRQLASLADKPFRIKR